MFKRLLFLLLFCLMFSVLSFLGQERERENSPRPEPKEDTKPVEVPRNDPPPPRNDPPPPPPRNDPPPREEPRQSNTNNSSNNNENNTRERRRDRDSDADVSRPGRGRRTDEEIKRPKNPENPPIENPPTENPPTENPPNNPNPPSTPPNNNNSGNKRNEDRYRRNRNGGWGGYPSPPIYIPSPSPSPTTTFSWRVYFDKDDVFFNVYQTFVDPNASNYLPYFDAVLRGDYEPLYYIYGREFYLNEFPFVADDWTIYYEPDLDDVFVNFNKFGKANYEKMVWFAIGDTYKKVAKKVKYSGQIPRPVLVETVPQVGVDKIYSFSVADLPKGEYEIRFIARNGTTLKHFIRLK